MGYTHYYTPMVEDSKEYSYDERWDLFISYCKRLHKGLSSLNDPIIVCGGMGDGNPIFGEANEWSNGAPVVWFNGDGSCGLDHETFLIIKGSNQWEFCKTNRKPYDLLVCSILLAAKDCLGCEIESDGEVDDWESSIKYYIDTIYGDLEDDAYSHLRKGILPDNFH